MRADLVALNLISAAKFLKSGWEPDMDYVPRITPQLFTHKALKHESRR